MNTDNDARVITVNAANVVITTGTVGSDKTQDFVVRNGYLVPASKRAVDAILNLGAASKRAAAARTVYLIASLRTMRPSGSGAMMATHDNGETDMQTITLDFAHIAYRAGFATGRINSPLQT